MNGLFTRLLGLTAGLAVVTACSTEPTVPTNRITFNNFESLEGWIPATATLSTEKAHSGRFAVKVDAQNEYGVGYHNLLGNVSPTRLKTLQLNLWALRTGNEAKAVVVVTVSDPADPNKPVFWQALDLAVEVKTFNRWTEVHRTFTLPGNINATQKLAVYLWRGAGSQPVYIDDLELLRE